MEASKRRRGSGRHDFAWLLVFLGPSFGCGDYDGTPRVGADPGDGQGGLLREAAPYQHRPYPEPPYGVGVGATLENFEVLGWRAPGNLSLSCSPSAENPPLERIDLAEFFDPSGTKGLELLVVNMSAVWCTVCRAEFRLFDQEQVYAELRPRGAEFVGFLFEDRDHEPARPSDLACWADNFRVDFPMLLDPGFKTGRYFVSDATPMNLVVDARNMQILRQYPGGGGAIDDLLAFVRGELAERGR